MDFEEILEEFHTLNECRSQTLKKIRDSENEINSISERIQELLNVTGAEAKQKDHKDQLSRARDKRKRIRQEISEKEHNVRMTESDIDKLKMRFRWLIEYQEDEDET